MKLNRWILKGVIALVWLVVYSYSFDSKPDMNGDNAAYYRLALNMSEGIGYSDITPEGIKPASHFPPGYPFILSIFTSMDIDSVVFFKIVNGIFLLMGVMLLFYLVRGVTRNEKIAFVIAILTLFSPRLINFSYMMMSEMSYMLFTALTIYALYRYSLKDKEKPFWRSPYFYIAVISAAASYYIRTIGLSAIFALIVFFVAQRNWRTAAAALGGTFILQLPWIIRNSVAGIESRYLGTITTVNPWRPEAAQVESVGDMIAKMIANFDETVIKSFTVILFPFINVDFKAPSTFFAVIIGLAIVAIMVYGVWNMGKMRYYILAFFTANIGLFMLWHGGNGTRYVVPLIPFIFAAFWWGAYLLVSRKVKVSPYLALLLILPMLSPIKELNTISKMDYMDGYADYFKMLEIVDDKVDDEEVIICRKPEYLVFYADEVVGVNYHYSLDDKEVIRDMVKKKADYVILDQIGFSSTPRYLYPAIKNNPELFELVERTKLSYLFKFKREEAAKKVGYRE